VAGTPVQFTAPVGGGTIKNADPQTDQHGMAGAEAVCGPQPGDQEFLGLAGGMTLTFDGTSRLLPVIKPNGAVNAASFRVGPGMAPGSYISLFGSGLSDSTDGTPNDSLPLVIDSASVSFDVPSANLSLPGRLLYVSPGQINLQVPWELRGQTSALIKITIEDTQGAVYALPLTDYSPAFYQSTEKSTGRVLLAARDNASGQAISSATPAHAGQSLQLYANGLGPIDTALPTGEPAPVSPLIHTLATPIVTIGGVQAVVTFSGLAPTYAGLYQVNVDVPSGVPSGLEPVVLTIDGIVSPASNLPVQ
jgi:uncharacterized protein (TIGR03437 family)